MHLLAFAALGITISIISWGLLGLRRYLIAMAILGIIEQAYFLWSLAWQYEPGIFDKAVTNTYGNMLLSGADIDLIGIASLLALWAITISCERIQASYRYLIVDTFIILVLIALDGQNIVAILMFLRAYDVDTKSIRFPRSHSMILAGFLIQMYIIPTWIMVTKATSTFPSMESLYDTFNVDVFHLHHFYIIFVGSWFTVPIIWSLPRAYVLPKCCGSYQPWVQIFLAITTKWALTVIFVSNICASYYLLWLLATVDEVKSILKRADAQPLHNILKPTPDVKRDPTEPLFRHASKSHIEDPTNGPVMRSTGR